MSYRILNTEFAGTIADSVLSLLQDEGYTPEEIIPGVIQAAIDLADDLPHPDTVLDEAADFLANGGIDG